MNGCSEAFALYLALQPMGRIMGMEGYGGVRLEVAVVTHWLCTGEPAGFLDKAPRLHKRV